MTAASVSIALCTFNGQRYLGEQLASLSRQTRLPDELVVCDDASTDGTVGLIQQFAATAPFPVHLYVNSTNVRSTKNFEAAIRKCRGEIIVLADQDDVWKPEKLERLTRFLQDNPAIGFVFSDAEMVDENRKQLGYTLWDAIKFTPAIRRACRKGGIYPYLLRRYCVTGATMAFRSSFRAAALPIPETWIHDAWIALIIAAIADGGFVEETLIEYRQHRRQQIGEKPRSLYQQFKIARAMNVGSHQAIRDNFSAAENRLRSLDRVSATKREAMCQKIEHCQARCDLRCRNQWRLPAVIREAMTGRYCLFSQGWKAICQDLFLQ